MIITLTPNPAVDVTYAVPELRHGRVHRVEQVTEAAGGKGVNVARVLAQLGEDVRCTGFLAGQMGEHLEDLLAEADIPQEWTLVAGETRRTVNVVDPVDATIFNEPGPQVCVRDWDQLTGMVLGLLDENDVLTVSGSTPPGTKPGLLHLLVQSAVELGATVIADSSGENLLEVASAGATCLKPNEDELLAATGANDVLSGARDLLQRGAGAVVVSRGPQGLELITPEGHWRAAPAETLTGNPTGAGDAAVAALAVILTHGGLADLPDRLGEAVALSGAAVLRPVAGEVDLQAYARMLPMIRTEALDVTV